METMIHFTSTIDDGAAIGRGTKIWHYSHIMSSATIGDNCVLGQNVFVAEQVSIGNGCKIQNNVSIYEGVILEDDVFCGPSMVFTNVRTPRASFPRNSSGDYHVTRVCKGASIGANATIVCGVTIGRWALVGAGAVVTHDVPAYSISVGVPAQQIGWACQCGERIDFEGNRAKCTACGQEYVNKAGDVCLAELV